MKEFFKPTSPKIVVFFLLPVLIGSACNAKLNPCPIENTMFSFFPLIIVVILIAFSLFVKLPNNEIMQEPVGGWSYLPAIFLIGFLSLVINYLIACSLIFLYDRVKNKQFK